MTTFNEADPNNKNLSVLPPHKNDTTTLSSFYEDKGPTKINTLAITSLVLGVLGTGVFAIITGHIAIKQTHPTAKNGRSIAVAGTIIGYCTVLLSIFIVSIFILIPLLVFPTQNIVNEITNDTSLSSEAKQEKIEKIIQKEVANQVEDISSGLTFIDGGIQQIITTANNTKIIIQSDDERYYAIKATNNSIPGYTYSYDSFTKTYEEITGK